MHPQNLGSLLVYWRERAIYYRGRIPLWEIRCSRGPDGAMPFQALTLRMGGAL